MIVGGVVRNGWLELRAILQLLTSRVVSTSTYSGSKAHCESSDYLGWLCRPRVASGSNETRRNFGSLRLRYDWILGKNASLVYPWMVLWTPLFIFSLAMREP